MSIFYDIGKRDEKIIQLGYKSNINTKKILECVYKIAHDNDVNPSIIVSIFSNRKLTMHENDDSTFRIEEENVIIRDKLSQNEAKIAILFSN